MSLQAPRSCHRRLPRCMHRVVTVEFSASLWKHMQTMHTHVISDVCPSTLLHTLAQVSCIHSHIRVFKYVSLSHTCHSYQMYHLIQSSVCWHQHAHHHTAKMCSIKSPPPPLVRDKKTCVDLLTYSMLIPHDRIKMCLITSRRSLNDNTKMRIIPHAHINKRIFTYQQVYHHTKSYTGSSITYLLSHHTRWPTSYTSSHTYSLQIRRWVSEWPSRVHSCVYILYMQHMYT